MKCEKCGGLLRLGEDIQGRYVSCFQCGGEIHPPLDPSVLPIRAGSVDHLPRSGEDSFTWKEKQRRPRGGRTPRSGKNPYRKVG